MRKVVGLHSCREVFRVRPRAIGRVLLRQGWEKSEDLSELSEMANKAGIRIKTVSMSELDALSHGHQGICLEVLEEPELDPQVLESESHSVLLGLDGIEDPQNLGSILRSAWLFGVRGIMVPSARALSMTPAVAKVASGGAEHVPVEVHSNLLTPLTLLKKKGFWVFGLSEKGTKSLWDVKIPEKIIWVVGAEGSGVRKSTQGICDELVSIPQTDHAASLNASICASIALAETCRQWALTPKKR